MLVDEWPNTTLPLVNLEELHSSAIAVTQNRLNNLKTLLAAKEHGKFIMSELYWYFNKKRGESSTD